MSWRWNSYYRAVPAVYTKSGWSLSEIRESPTTTRSLDTTQQQSLFQLDFTIIACNDACFRDLQPRRVRSSMEGCRYGRRNACSCTHRSKPTPAGGMSYRLECTAMRHGVPGWVHCCVRPWRMVVLWAWLLAFTDLHSYSSKMTARGGEHLGCSSFKTFKVSVFGRFGAWKTELQGF